MPMFIALTFVTGVVDAASYLKFGHVFVANMTGNVVFLGFALAGAKGLSAITSMVALATFLVGAAAGGWLGARNAEHRGRALRAASVAQLALIAVALGVALAIGEPPDSAGRYALLVPLALALGVQNAVAQRLAVPELTTTVLTRTLTGLASEAGFVGGPGSKFGRSRSRSRSRRCLSARSRVHCSCCTSRSPLRSPRMCCRARRPPGPAPEPSQALPASRRETCQISCMDAQVHALA